jgi:hypothetical protein
MEPGQWLRGITGEEGDSGDQGPVITCREVRMSASQLRLAQGQVLGIDAEMGIPIEDVVAPTAQTCPQALTVCMRCT